MAGNSCKMTSLMIFHAFSHLHLPRRKYALPWYNDSRVTAIIPQFLISLKIVSDCSLRDFRYDSFVHQNHCLEQVHFFCLAVMYGIATRHHRDSVTTFSVLRLSSKQTRKINNTVLTVLILTNDFIYRIYFIIYTLVWNDWCYECSYGRSALPPAQIVMWKERISQCLSLPTKARVRPKHPRIFIVKRPLAVGRGFVNLHEIAKIAQVCSFLVSTVQYISWASSVNKYYHWLP